MTRNQMIARGLVAGVVLVFVVLFTLTAVADGYAWWVGSATLFGGLGLGVVLTVLFVWVAENW